MVENCDEQIRENTQRVISKQDFLIITLISIALVIYSFFKPSMGMGAPETTSQENVSVIFTNAVWTAAAMATQHASTLKAQATVPTNTPTPTYTEVVLIFVPTFTLFAGG